MAIIGWYKDRFIVKNSWGEQWADLGYTYLPFSDLNKIFEAWTIIDTETRDIFNKRGKLYCYYQKKFRDMLKKDKKIFG